MRSVLVSLLLAACATAAAPPPDQRVAGCWIDRGQNKTVTMRWLRGDTAGVLIGDRLEYGRTGAPGPHQRFSLAPRGEAHALCELNAAGESGQCWDVAQGESGSLEGGRVFIDRHREHLRIAIVGGPGENRVLFEGQQDGCD